MAYINIPHIGVHYTACDTSYCAPLSHRSPPYITCFSPHNIISHITMLPHLTVRCRIRRYAALHWCTTPYCICFTLWCAIRVIQLTCFIVFCDTRFTNYMCFDVLCHRYHKICVLYFALRRPFIEYTCFTLFCAIRISTPFNVMFFSTIQKFASCN